MNRILLSTILSLLLSSASTWTMDHFPSEKDQPVIPEGPSLYLRWKLTAKPRSHSAGNLSPFNDELATLIAIKQLSQENNKDDKDRDKREDSNPTSSFESFFESPTLALMQITKEKSRGQINS